MIVALKPSILTVGRLAVFGYLIPRVHTGLFLPPYKELRDNDSDHHDTRVDDYSPLELGRLAFIREKAVEEN